MNGARNGSRSVIGPALAGLLVLLVLVVLSFSSCENAVSDALGLTSVEATDGARTDSIVVTWDAVTRTDADGNQLTVTGYDVVRTPGGTVKTGITDLTWTDTDVTPGVSYTYSVTANFSDSTPKDVDLTDTGYAMDATELMLYSSPGDGVVSYDGTGSDDWFNFLGQEGWTYRVTVTGGADPTVYRQGGITTGLTAISASAGVYRYRLPRSDRYHLRLNGGSGTISVSYE